MVFYISRGAQLLGMFMLLEDLLTDRGKGPNPNLFYAGIGVFIAGWALGRFTRK